MGLGNCMALLHPQFVLGGIKGGGDLPTNSSCSSGLCEVVNAVDRYSHLDLSSLSLPLSSDIPSMAKVTAVSTAADGRPRPAAQEAGPHLPSQFQPTNLGSTGQPPPADRPAGRSRA